MTYREMIREAAAALEHFDVPEAEWEAEALFLAVLKWQLTDYALKSSCEVSCADRDIFQKALSERLKRKPLQRIVSSAFFMGYDFVINEDTLIPRDDSEVLVRAVSDKLCQMGDNRSAAVLDMCTGSGCLILALLLTCRGMTAAGELDKTRSSDTKTRPGITGVGADIAPKAVEACRENAMKLGVKDVSFVCSDLFSNVTGTYDIIMSNPPYIPSEEISKLETEVRDHEPWIALDGGADGLDFYRKIIQEAPTYLNDGGSLLFEIGYDEGEAVRLLMEEGGFKNVAVIRDLAGLDRVVQGDLHV